MNWLNQVPLIGSIRILCVYSPAVNEVWIPIITSLPKTLLVLIHLNISYFIRYYTQIVVANHKNKKKGGKILSVLFLLKHSWVSLSCYASDRTSSTFIEWRRRFRVSLLIVLISLCIRDNPPVDAFERGVKQLVATETWWKFGKTAKWCGIRRICLLRLVNSSQEYINFPYYFLLYSRGICMILDQNGSLQSYSRVILLV